MGIKEIRQREVSCDRCRIAEVQPLEATQLPDAWGHVAVIIVGETTARPPVDLCPKHCLEVLEAMRPLVRVRQPRPEIVVVSFPNDVAGGTGGHSTV